MACNRAVLQCFQCYLPPAVNVVGIKPYYSVPPALGSKSCYQKQAHVGMEPKQIGMTPQYVYTIHTSCAVLVTPPTNCGLSGEVLMNSQLSILRLNITSCWILQVTVAVQSKKGVDFGTRSQNLWIWWLRIITFLEGKVTLLKMKHCRYLHSQLIMICFCNNNGEMFYKLKW